VAFRKRFQGKEDGFRIQLANLVNAKDVIARAVETVSPEKRAAEIRKEMNYLLEADRAGASHLSELLDRALQAFTNDDGKTVTTKKSVDWLFDEKVNRFEELLNGCKDLSNFKGGTEPEPLPDELKNQLMELEEQDEKRFDAMRLQMIGDRRR